MATNFNEPEQSSNQDFGNVLSVCWEKGKVAAAYYNLSTLELFVSHETLDISPEFAITMNLLRQVKPLHIVASGPNFFLKELLAYCKLPQDTGLRQYQVDNFRMNTLLPIVIYRQTEKRLIANRRQILEIDLPGMPEFSTVDREAYIESVFPLHQQLVVNSLGALLEYVNVNRAHLFLGPGVGVVVNDLRIYKLEAELLIDDFTMNSLQIFPEMNYHPSGYKKDKNLPLKSGFSIFRLVDRCLSRMGSKTMRMILSHPIRSEDELRSRYETIALYLSLKESVKMQQIKKYLKNVGDIGQTFRNMILQPEKLSNWHLFKKIVYNAFMVMRGCKDVAADVPPNTFFAEIARAIEDDEYLLQVLHVLDKMVDLDQGLSYSKFSVQTGMDAKLDEKKFLMISLQDRIQEGVQAELIESSGFVGEVCCYYIPELGYVIRVDCIDRDASMIERLKQNLMFVLKSEDAYYFQNNLCKEINDKYGSLYSEIREHESRICQRLISFLKERLAGIQCVVKLCAQLDCVLSFAQVADQMSLKKPQLVSEKVIDIEQGRNILWELRQCMVPNNFSIIPQSNQKLVTLLSAPNSSGKSVYLKQVALTAFLAHIGSFVPAFSARFGLLNSIYSRINCPESVHGNNSSFLSDVRQLGKVMTNSSDRSLILIDEFGKGTSFLEAQALLASCIEDLVSRGEKCPFTLISTHYADIYDIVHEKDRNMIALRTFQSSTNEDGEIFSTYRVKDGRTVRTYATKIEGVKKFMEELDQRSSREANKLAEIKVLVVVLIVWLLLHGETVDYKKIMDSVATRL